MTQYNQSSERERETLFRVAQRPIREQPVLYTAGRSSQDHAERLSMSVSASSCKASELTSTSRLPSATPALALGRPPITGTALHRDIVCCTPRAYAITRDHEHKVLASAPLSDLEFGSAFE